MYLWQQKLSLIFGQIPCITMTMKWMRKKYIHQNIHIGLPLAVCFLRIWHFIEAMVHNIIKIIIIIQTQPKWRWRIAASARMKSEIAILTGIINISDRQFIFAIPCTGDSTGQCKSCNVIINVPIWNLCVAKTVTHPIIELFFYKVCDKEMEIEKWSPSFEPDNWRWRVMIWTLINMECLAIKSGVLVCVHYLSNVKCILFWWAIIGQLESSNKWRSQERCEATKSIHIYV